jgi:hypothetical protein
MARTFVWRSALAVLVLAMVGCREELTMPGQCPALCPSSNVQLADTLLTSPDSADASFRGYVLVNEASFLLASNLDSLKSVMLMRFSAVSDSFTLPGDTVPVPISKVDSVLFVPFVGQRDTAAKHLRLVFYRLPAKFDTTMTYAQALPFFNDSLLADTTDTIGDSVRTGAVTLHLPVTLRPHPGDSGLVSLGVAVVASIPTAFAIASGQLGSVSPRLEYFVRGQRATDTIVQTHEYSVVPTFTAFVTSRTQAQPPSGELAVGGIPSARALLHLALPREVVDSNAIVRATLVLNLVRPVVGFVHDSFYVQARPLLRDFGPKSVLYPDSGVSGAVQVHEGDTAHVELDIAPILRLWGTTTGDSLPRVIVLRVFGEGQVLGEADFKGQAAGASGPQLRVTYVKRYHFGVP